MKYIVYKTTNLVNNFIYIGVHKTKNPEIFDKYLGCGVYANRPNTYEKAKTCFQQAVKQYGVSNFYRETLSIFNTPEEAYALEGLLVNENFLSRNDVYNMILGGAINYTLGKPVYMYSCIDGTFIKSFKSLQNAADTIDCDASTIAHSIKFKFKIKNYCFDYKQYNKLNLADYNFRFPIVVHRYTKEGAYDTSFTSLTTAGEQTLNTSAAYIQKAAELGYLVKDSYYFSFYKEASYDKARTEHIKNRKVYMYNREGNFIKEYEKQVYAEQDNLYCNITKSIRTKTPDKNGNLWSIVKLKIFNKPVHHIARKVAKLDEFGNILQTWESSNLCAKEVGVAVKNVLRGEYNKHKGFKYIYIS